MTDFTNQKRSLDAPQSANFQGRAASELTPLQVALRRKWLILAFALGVAVIMCGVMLITPPVYTATALVRSDVPEVQISGENASLFPNEQRNAEAIQTEMTVMNSPRLATEAAISLGLPELRAFQDCPPVTTGKRLAALWRRVRGLAPSPLAPCTASAEFAGKILLGKITSDLQRNAAIVEITASDSDPALAARIANGYADTYIAWQRDFKAKLTQEADTWLTTQMASMHDKMIASDAAIEEYRQTHHLIGLHPNQSDAVDTVTTQRLEQLNQELSNVSAALTQKMTTLSQAEPALHNGQFDAIAPVMESPIAQVLLNRRAELSTTLAAQRESYGPSYPALASTAASLARNDAQIEVEAGKIISSLKGEVSALSARKLSLDAEVSALERRVAGESQDNVKLSELQREAQTDRNLYETLFVRLTQVDAERHLQQPNAALVVEATPPDFPIYPRKTMSVVGAFLASLGVGVGLAFGVEILSNRFRDADQVETEIGLPVVGIFPACSGAPQDLMLTQPFSIEAETLQRVLSQIIGNQNSTRSPLGKVMLVTSALPGEGKVQFLRCAWPRGRPIRPLRLRDRLRSAPAGD